MIVCSCAVISDSELEQAVLEIMSQSDAPLPTPGVVYRHLAKRMNCCGCAPLAVDIIYAKMEELERKGLVCPCACATARSRMVQLGSRRRESAEVKSAPEPEPRSAHTADVLEPA